MNTEELEEESRRFVRRDLNFDFGQFFYPQEKKRITVTRYFTGFTSSNVAMKATVYSAGDLGTLNTFDERVFYSLVETWIEQKKPEITYFSERGIARKLCVKWGIHTARAISDSLSRLRLCGIIWSESFFDQKVGAYISIKNPFTILSFLQVTSTKENGIGGQIAEFSFDKRTVSNLELQYCRPIRFDVILSFSSPLAQALYTHLDRKLYGTTEYSRTTKGLLIEDLGLLGQIYSQKKGRLKTLRRAEKDLIKKELGYGEIIEQISLHSGKDDSIFVVKRSGVGRKRVKQIEVNEPQILRLNPELALPSPESELKISPEVQQVLNYFDKAFMGTLNNKNHSPKIVDKAQKIIVEHGIEKAKYLVDFAQQEAPKTNYSPKTFAGILQYLPQALENYSAKIKSIKEEKRRKQSEKQKELNRKRDVYKNQKEDEYVGYVLGLVNTLAVVCKSEFEKFAALESIERKTAIEKVPQKTYQEMLLRHFDRPSEKVARLLSFFKNHPTIKIPDFWEWDSEQQGKPVPEISNPSN